MNNADSHTNQSEYISIYFQIYYLIYIIIQSIQQLDHNYISLF